MRRLLIHPAIDGDRLSQLQNAAPELEIINAASNEEALSAVADADGFFGKMTPQLLEQAGQLAWVQSPTASLEHYLFPELIEHPCLLSNMRGLFSDVIADHVMGYVLCFARNLHIYLRRQMQSNWEPVGGESARSGFETGPGTVSSMDESHLHPADCSMGVVGVGNIGAEVCRRAAAFGMQLCGVDPVARTVPGLLGEIWPVDRLPELLARSDFVVIAAPHTPQTEKLFRYEQFSRMKPTAYLINIGRGVIVDLADLNRALDEGRIAGAALDVFEVEPLPADDPLWQRENVIITPHVAAASPRIAERHLNTLVENVGRFARGETPINLVDKRRWF
ncbi:MAG: D-2-hydroxyacid dehydrogenase [Planctomycetota bacterium]|nr:MAG: D-2-hydroxyacid dehydrogenase [Planctomycetota bacterium]